MFSETLTKVPISFPTSPPYVFFAFLSELRDSKEIFVWSWNFREIVHPTGCRILRVLLNKRQTICPQRADR